MVDNNHIDGRTTRRKRKSPPAATTTTKVPLREDGIEEEETSPNNNKKRKGKGRDIRNHRSGGPGNTPRPRLASQRLWESLRDDDTEEEEEEEEEENILSGDAEDVYNGENTLYAGHTPGGMATTDDEQEEGYTTLHAGHAPKEPVAVDDVDVDEEHILSAVHTPGMMPAAVEEGYMLHAGHTPHHHQFSSPPPDHGNNTFFGSPRRGPLANGEKKVNRRRDPTDDHGEFDSIMESEGFSMVSLGTLPSAKQQRQQQQQQLDDQQPRNTKNKNNKRRSRLARIVSLGLALQDVFRQVPIDHFASTRERLMGIFGGGGGAGDLRIGLKLGERFARETSTTIPVDHDREGELEMKRREADWQREREEVAREIDMANTSQVIVIDSSRVSENGASSSSSDREEENEEKEEEDDIWQQEGNSSTHDDHQRRGDGKKEKEIPKLTPSTFRSSDEVGTFSPAYWVAGNNNVPFLGRSEIRKLREQEYDLSFLLQSPPPTNDGPVVEEGEGETQVGEEGEGEEEAPVDEETEQEEVPVDEERAEETTDEPNEKIIMPDSKAENEAVAKRRKEGTKKKKNNKRGNFSDDQYVILRRLYRKTRDHPGLFPYRRTAEREAVIGDWVWTSDGRHGTPVTRDQFSIVDQFLLHLKGRYTEGEVHRRLISVVLAEQIRGGR